jgi:hypothetical protein
VYFNFVFTLQQIFILIISNREKKTKNKVRPAYFKMAHYKGAASEAGRAMQLMKKREKEMQDLELRKKRIEEDLKLNNIENKFATHYDAVEQQLKVVMTVALRHSVSVK